MQVDLILSNLICTTMPLSHQRWSLLASLRLIVGRRRTIGGVTGSHIALVAPSAARRSPLWARIRAWSCSAATVRDAASVGRALTGRDAVAITEDDSPAGAHELVLWQGAIIRRVRGRHFPRSWQPSTRLPHGHAWVLIAGAAPGSRPPTWPPPSSRRAHVCSPVRSRGGAEAVAAQARPPRRVVRRTRDGWGIARLPARGASRAEEAIRTEAGARHNVGARGGPGYFGLTRRSRSDGRARARPASADRPRGSRGAPGTSVLASDNPLDAYLVRHLNTSRRGRGLRQGPI